MTYPREMTIEGISMMKLLKVKFINGQIFNLKNAKITLTISTGDYV